MYKHHHLNKKEGKCLAMASKDRLEMIRTTVSAEKKVTVSELSKRFQVTEETIRRDLEKLEKKGVLTRTFGGAVLNENTQNLNIHYRKRAMINYVEKRKIAITTEEILKDKHTIATDASSTVMEAIRLLPNSRDLTVLSTSIEIFNVLGDSDINVISTGGIFNRSDRSLYGQLAKENVKKYHVDILLISCKGLDKSCGAMDSNEGESEVKKLLLRQADEVALLVDHSKFDRTAFTHLLDLSEINYLITDEKPGDEWVALCEKEKIRLLY